jgi:hypothetical protein
MKKVLLGWILICDFIVGFSQEKKDLAVYLGNPMVVDSSVLSNVMIPLIYKPHNGFITNQLWIDHYADILFYNPKNDSVKRLFNENIYIKPFQLDYIPTYCNHNTVYSSKWIFYFVKKIDNNKDGQIDNDDPYILYASDKNGNELKSITPLNENALSIDIYDKEGFALIKLQQDTNGNKKFSNKLGDFYYVRVDLKTLKLEKKISWP